jgi:hypothetical protein
VLAISMRPWATLTPQRDTTRRSSACCALFRRSSHRDSDAYIGRNIVNPASPRGDALTDLDIETDHAIIQVKSGRTDGLSGQIDRSRSATGKPVVAFAPKMRNDRVAFYRRHGYTVFLTIDDLVRFLETQR